MCAEADGGPKLPPQPVFGSAFRFAMDKMENPQKYVVKEDDGKQGKAGKKGKQGKAAKKGKAGKKGGKKGKKTKEVRDDVARNLKEGYGREF